jgi:prolyl-tRNA synthetase
MAEGHTAHATQKNQEETLRMLNVYATFVKKLIYSSYKRPNRKEKFAGAKDTFTIEFNA